MKKVFSIYLAIIALALVNTACTVNLESGGARTDADEAPTVIEIEAPDPRARQSGDLSPMNDLLDDGALPEACVNGPIAEVDREPFRITDSWAYGVANFTGQIVAIEEVRPWTEGEMMTRLYIQVEDDGSSPVAFNWFHDMFYNQGNTVNTATEGGIQFGLGELINGNEISSTAHISDEMEATLLQALETGDPITLDLTIPAYHGSGAPANFSFACWIQ